MHRQHTNCHYFFFFNDTATTEIYTLSLHDALPIFDECLDVFLARVMRAKLRALTGIEAALKKITHDARSEEHTSELQSQSNLVCRLLLEKKKIERNCPSTSIYA